MPAVRSGESDLLQAAALRCLLVAHVEQRFVIGFAYSADPVWDKNQHGTKY